MKRMVLTLFIVLIALPLFGCSSKKKDLMALDSDAVFEEENIPYEINQITFSKSFQSMEPTVEIITNNNKLKLLASLGLAEYSGVNVNKIVKKGGEINIHVSGVSDNKASSLSVPQVSLEIKKSKLKDIKDLKFNIVYDDFTPVDVKISSNDVLNKIHSYLKVSTKGSPSINLIKSDNSIIWDISYNTIFDKADSNNSLVNLSAQVDANTGEIIKSEKSFISSPLDNGHILEFKENNYLLYKKSILDEENNNSYEQLWIYNVQKNEANMIYSSDSKILSAQFSPNLDFISLIESNDNCSELYIISRDDTKAYKVAFLENFNPSSMAWKNNTNLFIIENNGEESRVNDYNVESNQMNLVKQLNKNVEGLNIIDDKFLIFEKGKDEFNNKISVTTDWKKFVFIDDGFSPKFINNKTIAYLQKNEKKDINLLLIYDIEKEKITTKLNKNILNYEIFPNGKIMYVIKDSSNNYTLGSYSIENNSTENIANVINDKIFYDENSNIIYLNTILPFENNKSEVIYSIDLSKLN
ncbi:hypothetical protein RBU61_12425 [Tissierella sp. MB52-C2]|uniref:hypothetical protein n=1 Tax=Tissierella sp. MB52-C2 TaxID=3070999 RepID=UPI00280BE69A|nr:hypothetical protein [Tissierella sp. MB52-C2]WMM23726.1 hypothetical protein RBU61_12425 [Tissierella sp. MB52-C2]